MSDVPTTNNGEVIPSLNRALTRERSGLVKRGLELIHDLKKQQVRVQIGDGVEPLFIEIFSAVILEAFKDKYELKIGSSSYGEEILELAENGAVDIFILIMNNIRFSAVDTVIDRLENSLQLLRKIKTKYGTPVIAMSGWSEDSSPMPNLVSNAKLAADIYLQMPFKMDALLNAFEKCLGMLHRFDKNP